MRRGIRTGKEQPAGLLRLKSMAVAVGDFDGRVVDANPLFLELAGYSRAQLDAVPLRWEKLSAPEHRILSASRRATLWQTGACPPWQQLFVRRNGGTLPSARRTSDVVLSMTRPSGPR
jgi:PAS domain-containing protein